MTFDILIRSYKKDFEWLRFSVASILKYVTDVRKIIVVVPDSDFMELAALRLPVEMKTWTPCDGRGYLDQQICKLYADSFSDADFIVHVDSDCVFTGSFSPIELMNTQLTKVRILYTPYASLPSSVPWQVPTQKALRVPVDNEYMRRFPLMYPRWVYGQIREYFMMRLGIPLKEYANSLPDATFSEFNVLGAFLRQFYPHKFEWVNTLSQPFTRINCTQHWSWGGIDDEKRKELEKFSQ